MTTYSAIKQIPDDAIQCLVRSGVIPLPVTQKVMIYEFYIGALQSAPGEHGAKAEAKRKAAQYYRVSFRTVCRAIAFCEGR